MRTYEIELEPQVESEIETHHVPVDRLVAEAVQYLEDPEVDDVALARMFIERGYSEELSYWLVRVAEVRHAPPAR
jgi:hypothetical protein